MKFNFILYKRNAFNFAQLIRFVTFWFLFCTVDLGVKSSMSGKEYDTKSSFKTFTINIFISNRKIIAWIVLVPFIKMVVNMIYTFSSLTATSAEASASELQIDIYPQNEKFPIFAAYIMYNLCFSAGNLFIHYYFSHSIIPKWIQLHFSSFKIIHFLVFR